MPIGGDDTLSFARARRRRRAARRDPQDDGQRRPGTEYCIGFSSAITRAKEAINRQRTTLGSHERIGVFRIFGRDAGFSALYTAYVTSARCVIPEAPYDLDALAALLAEDHAAQPVHYAFVIAAEGAIWKGAQMSEVGEADAFGHRHKADVGEALAAELSRRTGIETLASELTYDLRSGEPDALDQMVADDVRERGDGPGPRRRHRPDGGDPGRQVRRDVAAGPDARAAQRRRRGDVQRRAVPAALRGPARRSAAAGWPGLRSPVGRISRRGPTGRGSSAPSADMSSSAWPRR